MVDERAARGFAAAAEQYEAYRPSYPPAAVAFIREVGRLSENSTVVELGAGTGLMTRLLLPVGRLIAIEPVSEMRATLLNRVPEAQVVDGTAEEMPLPSAAADAIVVAQAFHWFATPSALREISRVLKPDGALILVWNVKDPTDHLMKAIDAVLAPYRLDSPGFASTPWQEVFEEEHAPLTLTSRRAFSFEEHIALSHLKGRVLSASYVALLEPRLRSNVLHQLDKLFGSSEDDTAAAMKYRTEVFVARRH
jgi:SAM-dependent methyltransferase